jgi:hypothetical protein
LARLLAMACSFSSCAWTPVLLIHIAGFMNFSLLV